MINNINMNYLTFEQPIIELEEKINSLLMVNNKKLNIKNHKLQIDIDKKIKYLRKKSEKLTKKIFSNLNAWQITQIARHPLRPYTLDYINHIFSDFDELSGDRTYGDDKAIIGGIARINNHPLIIIGHQKGRNTKEKIYRNFGMPMPEGYRKSLRLMKLAEKFKIPIVTFIDTPGAYPGIEAEERGQAESIAKNLQSMSYLKVPIICNIIGEGGSGGALAIGVGDKINMLQYSIYSVISPEGCASILWKNIEKAPLSAEIMGLTALRLKQLNLIDTIIAEPIGAAHRNLILTANNLKKQLISDLNELNIFKIQDLIKRRYNRLMNYGYIKN